MKSLFTEQKGNPKAGLLHGVALHLVNLGHSHAPGLYAAGTFSAKKLVQTLHIQFNGVASLIQRGEIMAVILIRLHDHFLKGHLGQQVREPFFKRKF